jgi:hypothetical protein
VALGIHPLDEPDRQGDGPEALVPERPEEVRPVHAERAAVDAVGIDADEREQRRLQEDALLGDGERDAQEQDGRPPEPAAACEFADEEGAQAPAEGRMAKALLTGMEPKSRFVTMGDNRSSVTTGAAPRRRRGAGVACAPPCETTVLIPARCGGLADPAGVGARSAGRRSP